MRHRKAGRKLKRTASHRRALLANLSASLLKHKRIMTTVAKAKETRTVVEKLITRAKHALAQKDAAAVGVHDRRIVARFIRDREALTELFSTIAEKVAGRPGGYTRVVKLGQRQGDGAEMAVLELVDFNTGQETTEKKAAPEKKKSARTPKKPAGAKKKTAGKEKAAEVSGQKDKSASSVASSKESR
jgi:large subunit ribosomal protein L17